ncbi:MAG: hypothetical protein GY794_10985, partial [bacterium]|nr:hypothetical protein [bacterium]
MRRCLQMLMWSAVLAGLVPMAATAGPAPVIVEHYDNSARYSAGWTYWKGQGPRKSSLHYANRKGDTVVVTFKGTEIYLLHKAGPDCGIARIKIDGKPVTEIDTYAPKMDWGRRTRLATGLAEGKHELRIEVTGRRNAKSINSYLQIIGFSGKGLVTVGGKPIPDGPSVPAELRAGAYPPIVFVKRKHFHRVFGIGTMASCLASNNLRGSGIYTIDPSDPKRREREIFSCKAGTIFSMDLSFDAKKLLFACNADLASDGTMKPSKYFHIFEISLDAKSKNLRQITREKYQDVDPVYLPDGRIVFASTRMRSFSMCQPSPASAMYTMNANGTNIRRIEFGTLSSHSPYILDNGQILYTRWEYQDKSVFPIQSLWTINPDGTRVSLFYGNTITNPNTIWQARRIPGSSELLCTMGPHHGNPVGAIGILNRKRTLEDPRDLTNITPEYNYVPSNTKHWRPGDKEYKWAFRDPRPVTKNLFVVSYGGPVKGGPQRYRLFMLHRSGARKLLHEDKATSCFNPIPIVRRPTPRVIAPLARGKGETGTFLVQDVYIGALSKLPRGTVKHLRVMTTIPKQCNLRRRAYVNEYNSGARHDVVDPVMGYGTFYVKSNLGTVPVEADGSVHFKAPAGTELYFQALDKDGKELIRMGSLTQIMPGEQQTCVGCHEDRLMAPPPMRKMLATKRPARKLTPPPWGAGPVDFASQVQPVLDKYCAKCHSGPKPTGGIDLSGDKTWYFNMAYDNLVGRHLVKFYYKTPPNEETGSFKALSTGSWVSPLTKIIESKHRSTSADHKPVNVDDQSRRLIYAWIDANAPYYGTYRHTRPGAPGSRLAWHGSRITVMRNGQK